MKYLGEDQKFPIGTIKVKKKFALLPKKISGKFVWLKEYSQSYIYKDWYFDDYGKIVKLYAWFKADKHMRDTA